MLAELSSILEFIFKLFDAISGVFARKRDDLKEMTDRLRETEAELRRAIAERRVTDAAALRVKRDELRAMIKAARKARGQEGSGVKASSVSKVATAVAVSAASLMASGCFSTSQDRQNMPLVVGERIIFVDPGQEIVVPPLSEPASAWYLIDDCALDQWLGISLDGAGREDD